MSTRCIYVVDDEETIREGIALALQPDFEVRTFRTAEDAIDAVRERTPDLVLLDLGLPGMCGLDALPIMKALHPEMPIIIITAYEDETSVASARGHGACDYVTKPLHMGVLEESIGNALGATRRPVSPEDVRAPERPDESTDKT